MSYDLTGKVKVIGDTQTFGSGFQKAELVVTVEDGKYPQDINIEFCQGATEKLEGVAVGDEVKVAFDIRGREYNGRYFNSLNGWKLEKLSASTEQAAPPPPPPPADAPDVDDEDDRPF